MKRRGGDDYVVATAKKGNPYAARVVLNKKRSALRRGKSVNTVFVPNARSHRTRRRNLQILPPDCLALLQNRGNFERSAAPERLMFFQNGTWRNFPADPTESLKEAFKSKIPTVVVENQGGKYLIDFIRMLQVDLVSGFERSIAWIDINGKCFFPKMFIGGDDSLDSSPLKLKIEINIDKAEPKAGGESEAQSENRAFEGGGGENGACQRGLKEGSCGDEMRTCGTREGTGESEAGEGGIRDSNSGNGVGEIATKEGKGENGVYGVDMRERSEGSGSLANQLNYVEPKEIVAYIPDLNQNGVDFNQNESAEMGNALKVDEVSLSHPLKSNSTRAEEVRVVSGSKENEVINSNFVNSREEYEAIKGLASLKRTLDSSFDIVEKTCQVKIPDSSKRARLSRSPEPKNMLEKPAFDSMGIVLAKLSETNKAYTAVKNLFLGGMTKLDEMAQVNEIYWCSHASPMGSARLEAFQKNMEMTKSSRGDANVKYAWYGASPNMVESAVVHGFGQVGSRSGGSSYGIGVYLTPEGHSYESACHSEPDTDNVFHVVLCRVIMGNMEQIEHGSHQFHPSNDNFDSGVDNLEEPRWYIVWSTHMNTNILPEFVVSFTVSQKLQELWRRNLMQNSVTVPQSLSSPRETRTPNVGSPFDAVPGVGNHHHPSMDARGQNQGRAPSPGFPPNMSFPSLFSALRGHLPQNTMESLDKVYNDYKVGEFPKDVLVRRVRSIAGDKVLISALRSLRNQA